MPITSRNNNLSEQERKLDQSKEPLSKGRKRSTYTMALLIPTLLVFFATFGSTLLNISTKSLSDEEKWLAIFKKSKKLFQSVPDSNYAYYDEQLNVLGTTYFSKNVYSRQTYVSNGYIGIRLSTLGQGFTHDQITIHAASIDDELLSNGWPLFNKRYTGAFVSGFYDLEPTLPDTNFPDLYANGSDSVITAIPYWANLKLIMNIDGIEYKFDPETTLQDEISNYIQNMSLQNGVVSTEMIWLDRIKIRIEVMAHKQIAPLGLIKMELSTLDDEDDDDEEDENVELILQDVLDFTTSQRAVLKNIGTNGSDIFMEVYPNNIDYSSTAVYSRLDLNNTFPRIENGKVAINEAHLVIKKTPTVINKYVGIISTEYQAGGFGTELENSKKIVDFAQDTGFDQLQKSNTKEWEEQFEETNIDIPSDGLLTLAARASLFHLLANTRIGTKDLTSALGTTGLSSDSYGGMVFWDTDLWIIPAILPFAPQVAQSLNQYRNYTHTQAKKNAEIYNYEGAAYPWTSGRFGNCTSTGPCINYEYHINVDIAFSSWLIYLAGGSEDYLRYTTWPLLRDASDFLSQYVVYNTTLGEYVTHNLTDPDEYANHVDNGAFTNAGIDSLMKWTLMTAAHLGEEINPRWVKVNNNIHIPRSETGITLEYSEMNATVSIKQADVILLTFPLDFNDFHSYKQAKKDLFYYSLKQADVGPAMTFPIFTISAAKLLNHGCSVHSYLQKSVLPYIRAPFAQFSEQADDNILTNGGTHPAFPFLTGHGGYLQALVYGIHGLRFSAKLDSNGKIDRFLVFDPIAISGLPGGMKISGFKYLNQLLDVIVTDIEGIIIHKGVDPINVQVRDRNPKAGNYTLQPGEKLRVPVFFPSLNIEGSAVECRPVANLTVGSPGDVPLSAIDGNNYTYWQPLDRNPGRLLIDLGFPKKITKGLIIWGSRPAKYLSIYGTDEISLSFSQALKNIDSIPFKKLIDNLEIKPSEPFDEKYLKEIKLLPNNITEFEITNPSVLTRYVIVEIIDALDETESEGGTLNEIALF